jgi:exodeoxyribonuclease III
VGLSARHAQPERHPFGRHKGFVEWAESGGADCMGVQESRPRPPTWRPLRTRGRHGGHFHFAEKKGYSGVGLYTPQGAQRRDHGFGGAEFDAEGRWVEARFDTSKRKLSLISCYFPSGSSGEERQQAKFRFLARLYPHLMQLKAEREFILVGDVNIAHQAIDLKNWRSNQKNSGFLPEERAWMTRCSAEGGLVDVFRTLNTQPEQYTWWSNRGQAWAKNVGWRLDYHLATPALAARRRHRRARAVIYLRHSASATTRR